MGAGGLSPPGLLTLITAYIYKKQNLLYNKLKPTCTVIDKKTVYVNCKLNEFLVSSKS